jgi:prepilin-type N-terminal cleavage/methylation domain-containing protein
MAKCLSAFSLIETLVALLILSIGLTGAGTMLTQGVANFQVIRMQEKVSILVWSIADYIRAFPNGGVTQNISFWQQQLDQELPGSVLSIRSAKNADDLIIYTITVQSPFLKKVELEIIT